jgi:AcrR family transcriptional regulator
MLCYGLPVPRPRVHDLDAVLDAAESLAVEAGPAGVTTRSVAAAAGVSNGAIYHNFGSRTELVARTWLRAARRFLDVQTELVDTALAAPAADPVDAVVAAAQAPAVFYERQRQSAQLVWRVQRDQLLGPDLPASLADELKDLDRQLIDLMVRLSSHLWDRRDGAAVDAIMVCIVDLPTAIILSRNRISNSWARDRLTAAVRAVLADEPTPTRRKQS